MSNPVARNELMGKELHGILFLKIMLDKIMFTYFMYENNTHQRKKLLNYYAK